MLLDEIIEILSNENGTLNSALLKTKVLLHSLGKKELVVWVTNELKGYPDENVPDYRIVGAEVHGHVTSVAWQMTDYVLPIMHLTKQQQDSLTTFPCTMSISSIEESIKNYRSKGSKGKLIRSLPPEYGSLFQKVLSRGTNIVSAWCEINMMNVERILPEVRSRLLDFALELRDVVGANVSEKELTDKAAAIDTEKLFTTAVYGTGNTIIIGSHSIQAITNRKDDIEGLIQTIGKLGFRQNDLNELRQAVLDDKSKGKIPDVTEGETGKWFSKAIKGAGKEVVRASVDVVSSVIVKAIKAYTTGGA